MKNKETIGIGFIGCGGHSRRHADVLKRTSGAFAVVAAFDGKQEVTEQFLSVYAPTKTASTSLREFFKTNGMDAVFIGTPHDSHLTLCTAAVNAQKHVLCEKPLWVGPYADVGRRVISIAASQGLIFSSCHLRRFEEHYLLVKERLAKYIEDFGPAVEVRFQFFYHEPSTGWKMNDSLLLDHMNHEIDLVHFLFGHSPAKFWRISQGYDQYRVAGRTEGGLGIWFTGYRRLKNRVFRNELEIIFERGRVRAESVLDSETGQVGSTVFSQSFENDDQSFTEFTPHSYDDALVGVMTNFAAAIRGEELCYLTAKDMIVNTAICNDLLENEFADISK